MVKNAVLDFKENPSLRDGARLAMFDHYEAGLG